MKKHKQLKVMMLLHGESTSNNRATVDSTWKQYIIFAGIDFHFQIFEICVIIWIINFSPPSRLTWQNYSDSRGFHVAIS